ncbi:MAG: hypothetical protein CL845_06800 [Crocinitomicaceae bacterium]|nr:hypothetical protein [Crocinitomicaceae bacterium]
MYLSTTDSYASGSKSALSIDSTGIVRSTRSRIESVSDIRGTQFYDIDNTGYYVNPAAGSKLVYLGLATDPQSSGSYRLNMGGNIHMNNNHIHYVHQLHFNGGTRFETLDGTTTTLWADSTSAVQLNLGTGAQERNGAVYANSSNQIGFLDSDNHWAIRHAANSFTEFRVNNIPKVTMNNLGIRFETDVTTNSEKNALMNMANLAGANLLTASTDIARRYSSGANRELRTFVDGTQVPCHYSQGTGNNGQCYQWISTEFVDVDPEKSYQYTLWVQAEGDHNIYMGWHEKNAAGSTITSNPYFHTSTMDTNGGWVKITGILHGHRTSAGQSDTEGTDRFASGHQHFLDGGSGAGSVDGVMHSTTRKIMMRFGSCYGTANTAKTYFYAPTIKEINYENHQHGYTVPIVQNNVIQQGCMHIGKTSWSNYSGIEYRDCSGSQEFRMSSTSGDLNLRVDGTVQAHGSGGIEASIFKDINNASYYVHPDSTSVLNNLQLNGSLRFDNSAGAMDKSGTTLKIGDIDENDDYSAVDILAMAGTGRVYIEDSAVFIHGTSASSAKFRFTGSGQLDCDADVIAFSANISSDRKLKENIRPLENSLDKVLTLDGVKFDWKDEERDNDQIGFIAQDIEKVLPELVSEVDTLGEVNETHKVVNYDGVIPVLVEAIKELKAEIDELKDKLNNK